MQATIKLNTEVNHKLIDSEILTSAGFFSFKPTYIRHLDL